MLSQAALRTLTDRIAVEAAALSYSGSVSGRKVDEETLQRAEYWSCRRRRTAPI
jgi:hypothetical protein